MSYFKGTRRKPVTPEENQRFHDTLRSLPVYNGAIMVFPGHPDPVTMGDRVICNCGCGSDLGPANG